MKRVVRRAIRLRGRPFEPRRIEWICQRLARTPTQPACRAGALRTPAANPKTVAMLDEPSRSDAEPTRFMHNAG